MKINRQYTVLTEEHLLLRKSYTNLEEKWAITESALK
jgi:hypothetical protein